MALAEANPAAREATGAVAMVERAPYRRRDRARARADFDDTPVAIMLHHHTARIACQAARRFRRNAPAVLESGLARCIRLREHRSIDVHDDLVSLAGRAGFDAVMQSRLGE